MFIFLWWVMLLRVISVMNVRRVVAGAFIAIGFVTITIWLFRYFVTRPFGVLIALVTSIIVIISTLSIMLKPSIDTDHSPSSQSVST